MKLIMEGWREYESQVLKTEQLLEEDLILLQEAGIRNALKNVGEKISQILKIPGKLKELHSTLGTAKENIISNLPETMGQHWNELLANPPENLKASLNPIIAAMNVAAIMVEEKKGEAALQEEVIYEKDEKEWKYSKWNLLQRLKVRNQVLASRWSMWQILEDKLNQAESYEESKETLEWILQETAKESKEWKDAKKELEMLTNDAIYQSIMKEVEQVMGDLPDPSVARFLRAMMVNATAEFIFGFFDNFVLVMVGNGIDDFLMTNFGFGTWVAASQSNTVSDAGGGFFAKLNDRIKRYLVNPRKTAYSREIEANYHPFLAKMFKWSGLIGLILGCTVGSIPAFFMKSQGIAEGENIDETPA